MLDKLGDRMKKYENLYRFFIPPRSYVIIRLDGKAFHTYTKYMEKPADKLIEDAMDYTVDNLCNKVQNVKLGYTESDEISLLLTDFNNENTSQWYDGNIQKMVSVSASIATAVFNRFIDYSYVSDQPEKIESFLDRPYTEFDSRIFVLPDEIEVENYFIWRNKDSIRNSISSHARSLYSHNELMYKNSNEKKEMIIQKGDKWENLRERSKFGGLCIKRLYLKDGVERSKWETISCFDFLEDREKLTNFIPIQE